jgi:SOS-response transcriptional repressor LexA
MKGKSKSRIKQKYTFEAPVLPARTSNATNQMSLFDYQNFNIYSLIGKTDNYFLVRVNGESMIDKGIYDGDLLIVNSKAAPDNGKIVIASINDELLVKELRITQGKVYLYAANKKFIPIEIFPEEQFEIQGVVEFVIHNV